MGTPPAKIAVPEVKPAKAEKTAPPPRKLTCYVMPDKPSKPGLLLVSTTRTEAGCYVLGWQPQATTWIVSESSQWYSYSSSIMKANFAFTAVFALGLLLVLFLNRRV